MSIGIHQQNVHRSCIHFVACLHLLAVTSNWLEEKSSVMRRRALASHFLAPSKDARLWFHAESWKLTPTSASIGWSGMLAYNYCRKFFVCQLTVSSHSHHSQWVASRYSWLCWEKVDQITQVLKRIIPLMLGGGGYSACDWTINVADMEKKYVVHSIATIY